MMLQVFILIIIPISISFIANRAERQPDYFCTTKTEISIV